MRKVILAGLAAAAILALPVPTRAGDIDGVWLTESGDTHIQLYPCGANYCGKVVWLAKPQKDVNNPDAGKRSRPVLGIRMIWGAKPQGGGKYKGKLYNYADGETYTGVLKSVSANKLELSGCVFLGIVCRSQTWTRVK